MITSIIKNTKVFIIYGYIWIIVSFYNDEPKPTYEPQKKIPTNVSAAVPATTPTSHNGIRPVVPVLDISISP